MSDRDALAREMATAVFARCNGQDLADIALRHIEAARADERERAAVLAWSTGMDLHTKMHDVREVGAKIAVAIRDGSPAPAAPVVWTETDHELLLRVAEVLSAQFPKNTQSHDVLNMRAALEAASRETSDE